MKANRGLTIGRMVELGGVSRASFYRFGADSRPEPDRDMDLRDAIQRVALEWRLGHPADPRPYDRCRCVTGCWQRHGK